MFSNVISTYARVKRWFMRLIDSNADMMRVHFSLVTARRVLNFHGRMPKQYWTNQLHAGFMEVMAMAQINAGWEDGGERYPEDVDLFAFALERIGAVTMRPKARSVSRKRRN